MGLQSTVESSRSELCAPPASMGLACDRRWFAVFTTPQHEKSVVKHLAIREIESFLPTYETTHLWKNRQRVRLVVPLFPNYLFVHIGCTERARVLQSPGVIQLVGECSRIRSAFRLRDRRPALSSFDTQARAVP